MGHPSYIYGFHHLTNAFNFINVNRLFPAAGVLGPDNLRAVLTELVDVCADWENVGLELGLNSGTLDGIKGPFKDHRDCLRDMLKKWLNTSPGPSWEGLVQALRSPIVGKVGLASQLEAKFCTQEGGRPPEGK